MHVLELQPRETWGKAHDKAAALPQFPAWSPLSGSARGDTRVHLPGDLLQWRPATSPSPNPCPDSPALRPAGHVTVELARGFTLLFLEMVWGRAPRFPLNGPFTLLGVPSRPSVSRAFLHVGAHMTMTLKKCSADTGVAIMFVTTPHRPLSQVRDQRPEGQDTTQVMGWPQGGMERPVSRGRGQLSPRRASATP